MFDSEPVALVAASCPKLSSTVDREIPRIYEDLLEITQAPGVDIPAIAFKIVSTYFSSVADKAVKEEIEATGEEAFMQRYKGTVEFLYKRKFPTRESGDSANLALICTFRKQHIENLLLNEKDKLVKKLSVLLERFHGNLKGKSIVDLGCGNNGSVLKRQDSEDGAFDFRYQPWFCRLLHILGANVTGVDIGNLKGEPFMTVEADLLQENALQGLESHSADAVVTDGLYRSFVLSLMKVKDRNLKIDQLRERLFPQIKRILKAEGFYMEDGIHHLEYPVYEADELNHEQCAIKEIDRHLADFRKNPENLRCYVASRITELLFPYLLREYQWVPEDEEMKSELQTQCTLTLHILKNHQPESPYKTVIEIVNDTGEMTRKDEPWISMYLQMLGQNTIVVPLSQLAAFFGMERGNVPYILAEKTADVVITPVLDGMPVAERMQLLQRMDKILKESGICLARKKREICKHDISWLKEPRNLEVLCQDRR